MLRTRLFTNLLFNFLLAGWVLHDARTRKARKPVFAAFLTLLWGPIGLAFWASERPLALGERRRGGRGWVLARTFLLTWTALVPAIFVLVVPDMRERSAVPESLAAQLGIPQSSTLVTLVIWAAPALIAALLGALVRRPGQVETGTSATPIARPSLTGAILAAAAAALILAWAPALGATRADRVQWRHLSSSTGDLPVPGPSTQQTGALVADLDGDGVNDFVLSVRQTAPALVWYRRTKDRWDRYLIEPDFLTVEAGGAAYDIDGDGDLDLVFGGDWQSTDVWWWENPGRAYTPDGRWTRRVIKTGGATQHHDQVFGDFLGVGHAQLAFWNQNAKAILLADIPPDPRATSPWPIRKIFEGAAGEPGGLYPEGMATMDVDGDGRVDLLAGNAWFKVRDGVFQPIKVASLGGRIAAGQLVEGGRPEIVIAPGDGTGPLRWYSCDGNPADPAAWTGHDLAGRDLIHGHSLALADIDGDGHLDVFAAEMAKWTESRPDADNPAATAWIFYGDGRGHFTPVEFARGMDFHEARVADLDGDGRLDVLEKPYNWNAPRVDVWLNRRR